MPPTSASIRTESALTRRAMAHDASHFLLIPSEVATPRDADEVASLFREANRTRRPLTFRSGGTSLSGQAVTSGTLVDTRRFFSGIEVLDDGARVRVGAGVTLGHVNAVLRRHGRRLGPDPASEIACTIGGIVANNSSGMLCGTSQNTYATVESMVVVLPNGRIVDTAAPTADMDLRLHEPELVEGLMLLRRRILRNPESVGEIRRLYSLKNTMGYGVNTLIDYARPVDIVRHLMVGSEGTLGFVAQATFRTVPLGLHCATGLAIFASLDDATAALPSLVAAGFDAIELMDATSLKVAQELPAATLELLELQVADHTALLLELQSPTAEELAERQAVADAVLAGLGLTHPVELTRDPAPRAALWQIRKGLYASVAANRPAGTAALLEDIAVPVHRLNQTCRELTALLARHRYDASVIFGHAKDGNLHFMLTEDFEDPASLRRFRRFTRELVRLVLRAGGTLKAEHGTGRVMAPFVRDQFGDELYEVMREIKSLFDPGAICNPDVIITNDSSLHVRHLKSTPTVEKEVDRCVECGYCEPVCPSKDLTVTPRQRIVLRRELAAHPDDAELAAAVEESYEYQAIDTCAVDGMCSVACPLGINTGDLVRRQRADGATPAERRTWLQAARHWGGLTGIGSLALSTAKLASPLAGLATAVGRRALGKDNVPLYSRGMPSGGKVRRRPSRKDRHAAPTVAAYFPACIQSMFGPESIGVFQAFEELCKRAGVPVRLMDARDMCCGTPWKSKGYLEGYSEMRTLVRHQFINEAPMTVVCDASSCTQGLKQMVGEDLKEVHIVDLLQFAVEHLLPRLEVTQPVESIALHPTCSTVQLGLNDHMLTIARAMSDDVVVPAAWGCCGFAGDRGMLHPELTASATAAEAEELGRREYAAYASANRTCELGMERATGKPWVHVVELLALATRPAQ